MSDRRTSDGLERGDSDDRRFMTTSSKPIRRLYDAADANTTDLGAPGDYPFTRGIHATGYRGKLWTMRMFAGFGSAEETNERFRYLLDQGQTGLSVAFDLPTLMGYDTDAPEAPASSASAASPSSSLADMEILLDGLPLDEITTSMTINSPAAAIWAMYIAAAEKRGVSREQLGGHAAERHPQGVHRPEGVHLPAGAVDAPRRRHDRVRQHARCRSGTRSASPATTSARPARRRCRSWRSRSPTASSTCAAASTAGCDIDDFAPRLSFFFNCHNDFFEEIAKFRAARRIWAREMRETFGAKDPRSWWMRFHTQTAGVSLTAQQPEVNLVRTTIQALAAVLGGTQSLHTNSMDEALALPSEKAATLALRTQQVIAHESGVGEHRRSARRQLLRRDADERDGGGGVRVLRADRRSGRRHPGASRPASSSARSPTRRTATSARSTRSERVIVGVNDFVANEPLGIPILEMDPAGEARQIERLRRVRRERDGRAATAALRALEAACRDGTNVMPPLLDAANAYCTLGEMCDVMRQAFGSYQESAVI